MDSIREQIIQRIYEKVSVLTPMPVERCRRSELATGDLFISVWDGISRSRSREYKVDTKTMTIGIEAAWLSREPSLEANEVMAMIEAEFYKDNKQLLDGLLTAFNWNSSIPDYPTDGSNVTTVRIEYECEYMTPIGDPYTNAATNLN